MSVILSQNLILEAISPDGGALSPNAPAIGWENFTTFGSVTSTYQNANYPIENVANESTALEWRSTSTATQYITIDVPANRPVDYVGLATHNLSSAVTEVMVEVAVESGWQTALEPVLLPNDGPTILRFQPTFTTQVRIRLRNSLVAPWISVIYVGSLLLLPRNIYVGHTPINYGRNVQVSNGKNEAGDFLGRIVIRRSKSTQLSMMNIPPDWFRTHFEPFMEHAAEYPFFFAWRPHDYPFEVGYAWSTDDIAPSNQLNNGFMEFTMSFGAIAGRAGIERVPLGPKWTKTPTGWVRNY